MKKILSFVRRFYSDHLFSAIIVSLAIIIALPTLVAFATYTKQNFSGHWLITDDTTHEGYFYRTQDTDTNFTYGYGYGYANGTKSYGYGYGYAYGYYASNAGSWDSGDLKLGYFYGAGTSLSTTVVFDHSSGVATVPVPVQLTAPSGLTGVVVAIPASTVITCTDTTWDGSLTVTASTTAPSGFTNASVVTITGPSSGTVALSDEVVVTVPYSYFAANGSNGLVQIVDGGGTTHTVSACSATEYTGSDYADPAGYSLSAGGDCYTYDASNIYVATRHFSAFSGGLSSSASSSTPGGVVLSPGGGGGGGGGSNDDDEDEEEESAVEEATGKELGELEVTDYDDLGDLVSTDWEYAVIETVLELGLFEGEVNAAGEVVFNMYGTMNRAQAAQVLGRYYGCDLDADPEADPFSDVDMTAWYAPAVACLKDAGAVGGKTATTYAPADTVTRAEFFKMLTEIYLGQNPSLEDAWTEVMATGTHPFVDVAGDAWYAGYVALAYDKGLLSGYEEGGVKYMKPNLEIVRVEGAAMVTNFVDHEEEVVEEEAVEGEEEAAEGEGEAVEGEEEAAEGEGEAVEGEEEAAEGEGEAVEGEGEAEEGAEGESEGEEVSFWGWLF